MEYVEHLRWRDRISSFEPEQQKILMALSNRKYLWRSLDRLQQSTRLTREVLTSKLKELMADGWVRASVSKKRREPIYGLVERVGPTHQSAQTKQYFEIS